MGLESPTVRVNLPPFPHLKLCALLAGDSLQNGIFVTMASFGNHRGQNSNS